MTETADRKAATEFYKEALELLNENGTNYLLGGAAAFFHYTGCFRDTKDLDIFCKSSEYPRILKFFGERGYRTEITDARWIAKVFNGEYYIDIIFDTPSGICCVDDSWFAHANTCELAGVNAKVLSAEDLIWCKIYVQNRERYDGADVNHVMLRYGSKLDWRKLFDRLDRHWQLLLGQLMNFQFIYPSEFQDIVPRWLFDELIRRAADLYDQPVSLEKVCRGPMLDQTQYAVDIKEWNYKTLTMKSV